MRSICLSAFRPIRTLLSWRGFPEGIQGAMLMAFVAFMLYGWGRYVPQGIDSKLFAKANLVNLLVWGVWWPLMVLVAALLGRVWCAICPMELVSRFGESAGRRLGIAQRLAPRWLRAGWLILVLYGVVLMLISVVELHRIPMYTSLYLMVLLTMALLAGVFFKHRGYCYSMCAVGLLLKVYGRGGMLAVRPLQPDAPSDPSLGRACKSRLNPMRLDRDRGDDCLVCMDCVQADPDNKRVGLFLRGLWSRQDQRPVVADWPVTLFIMMVSGFVTYEVAGYWPQTRAIFFWFPDQMGALLGLAAGNGWMKGVWMILILPLAMWLALGLAAALFMGSWRLGWIWRRMAYPLSLIVLVAHITKSLEKLSTWGGYLPHALREPSGVTTSQAITDKALVAPGAIVPLPVIFFLGAVLLAMAFHGVVREEKLHRGASQAEPMGPQEDAVTEPVL